MYTIINFKTIKELKLALASGPLEIYQPGLGTVPVNGRCSLEGPHYPRPHSWYADGIIKNGKLVAIEEN